MRDGGGGVRVGGGVGGWGEGWGGETVLKGKVNLYEPGRIIIFQYLIYKKTQKHASIFYFQYLFVSLISLAICTISGKQMRY